MTQSPIQKEVAEELRERVKVIKIDVDQKAGNSRAVSDSECLYFNDL
jgi:hypothetical protein